MVVSNMFYFQPYLGKWSNLTSIFQRGSAKYVKCLWWKGTFFYTLGRFRGVILLGERRRTSFCLVPKMFFFDVTGLPWLLVVLWLLCHAQQQALRLLAIYPGAWGDVQQQNLNHTAIWQKLDGGSTGDKQKSGRLFGGRLLGGSW